MDILTYKKAQQYSDKTGDGKLIGRYEYPTLQEYQPISIDTTNDTFYLENHGLSVSTGISDSLYLYSKKPNITPLPSVLPTDFPIVHRYYVVNPTTNEFQLSETEGGTPITLNDNTSLNLSKIAFQKRNTMLSFNVDNLPDMKKTRIRFNVSGTGFLLSRIGFISDDMDELILPRLGILDNDSGRHIDTACKDNGIFLGEIIIDNELQTIEMEGTHFGAVTSQDSWNVVDFEYKTTYTKAKDYINSVELSIGDYFEAVSPGSYLEVYKLE